MSQIFQNYEAEFADLVSHLRTLVSQVGGLSGQLRESKVAEVDKSAGEGEALLRRMELEARSIGGTQKSELLTKVEMQIICFMGIRFHSRAGCFATRANIP